MKNRHFNFVLLLIFAQLFTGCELAEGIFKAGMWVGILIVVAIVAVIIWIIRKMSS